MSEDDWYAGYVNYCADAGYIKGFEDNTFRADENVTGYQVLAMILRAVGYDKNNEYTGVNWTLNVASTAMDLKLLKNVDSSVSLTAEATRELVAEFIFQAIRPGTYTVDYVPAVGDYRPDTRPASSLGEQVFDLALDPNSADAWGRPSDTWYANDGKYNTDAETIYAVIEEEALATYTTAVAQCDVADDVGIAKSHDFTTYTNGTADANKGAVTINANATKATIGEQGRLTEVYEDTIVYIDTFLAKVTNVVGSETDGNGHLDRQALLELEVYNAYRNKVETVYLTSDTDYTYAVGDMLLVNAYTDKADAYSIATTSEKVEGYVNQYDLANHLEVVQAAESFVGAQTEDWVNAHKHVIDGETYMDAFRFSLDQTNNKVDDNETINYNWWLDQYDNIIGVTAIDRTDYAVMKDIKWVVGSDSYGYAQATLVYMDGSEDTVTVNTIDGNFKAQDPYWDFDDVEPSLDDAHVGFAWNDLNISEEPKANADLEGYALYLVYTNDDGTVNLEGYDKNSTHNVDDTWVGYASASTIDVNKSTIWVDDNNDNQQDTTEVEARFDGSTQFIVNNDDGTYSAYTRDTLPTFAEDSLEVFWSLDGTYASSVYIKSSTLFAEDGTHLFTTTDASYREVGGGVHVIDAVVDGVERTIRTVDDDVINTLMENEGKLFHVTFQDNATLPNYGFVTDVDLVNEYHDSADCTVAEACNYTVSEKVVPGTSTIAIRNANNNAIEESYNITNATTIVNLNGTIVDYNIETIEQAVENLSVGIWVVEDENGAAAQIYIGTRLTNDDALDVLNLSTEGATGKWSDTAANTYEITIPYNTKECNVTVAAAAQNAVLVDSADKGHLNPGYKAPETCTLMFNTGLDQGGNSRTATVTVWAEDGVTHTEYTIKVTRAHNDTIDGIIDKIQDNSSGATCINSGTTLYSTLDAAIANMGTLTLDAADDLSIVWDGTSYTATYRSYSNTTDLEAAVGADISYPFWQTPVTDLNEYLVIKVTNGSTGFTLADNCTVDAVYIVYNLI